MFNANEIRQITFEKVVRGYRPEDVESFMEKIADEFEALAAEKQEIEGQLYILAERIEQYKTEEESIKATLISAQKLGESIIAESRQKAEAILKDANIRKNDILASAHEEFAMYEENLARIKKETSDFKIHVLSMYKDHIESLSRVPEIKAEPAAVVAEEQPAEEKVEETAVEATEEVVEEAVAEQPAEEIAAEEQTIVFEKETAQEENNKFNNISSLFD
ncbi:MAG: DivIVA domain-containing protein [Oscillospiraceae bacterium]|nr:DivIVA domain-containing protein [Oscillospiraceae bacterium]MBQ5312939.1 DivIVA domain-containing protein [Oscillospiraceae bacterium]MBQ5324005.1 DivIVA domain-containing protein [Oscillospiraceae bacterium]